MMGQEKYAEEKEQLMIQNTAHHLSNKVETVLWMGQYGCQGNWVTVFFIDDVTTDGSTRNNLVR